MTGGGVEKWQTHLLGVVDDGDNSKRYVYKCDMINFFLTRSPYVFTLT